ncbi:UNVERIFIED_CONTAM: hypothetical protein H355_008004 [Colinus virginianus]|nr:hypothetical protein H355_008004 [Colinus virginianus]
MASAAYALLITLCNVWSLITGAAVAVPDVAVTCSEEALLPCKVLQDSSITYQAVSWYKDDIVAQVKKHICVFQMAGVGDRTAWKVLDVESRYPKGLGGSLELCNNTLQLRIRNATSQDSGTYKCTLGEQRGDRNLSGTVTLKVTGCPGIEDEKLKKYKTEISMLTCLGIFYLLLIFFTCLPNAVMIAMKNFPGFIMARDESHSIPRHERSVTTSRSPGDVGRQRLKFSVRFHSFPGAQRPAAPSNRFVPRRCPSTYLSFESLKRKRGNETTSPRNKRAEEET